MKIESKQPLNYQQQNSSCWITSVMNGMVSLLGSAYKIPNEIARIIYAISSKDGTELKETEKVANFINSYNINLKCRLFKCDEVTPTRLRKILDRNGVAVADVCSGTHSVLVTGYSESKYKVFDPNWDNIKAGRRGKIPNADFPDLVHHYNILVQEEELFANKSTKTEKLRMGAISSRCLFVMELR